MARFLLILALVIHPLAVVGGLGPCSTQQVSAQPELSCCCGPTSCCTTEQVPACGCSVESAPQPSDDQPATPRVVDSQIVLLALVLASVQWNAPPADAPSTPAVLVPPHSSNNQRQAVLCTWRT